MGGREGGREGEFGRNGILYEGRMRVRRVDLVSIRRGNLGI
jgi:hypothetical protein